MDYTKLAAKETVIKVIGALTSRNVEAMMVETKEEALAKIKELIPPGAGVMNGSSRTLEEIGFVEYLKSGTHGWNNLHEAILAEKNIAEQAKLRKQAALSDFYLGSVHALAQTGEMVIASNSGSQLPHVVYTSPNLLLVVGTQKIMPTLEDALKRLKDYVAPLEDTRMKDAYGVGTNLSKMLIFNYEHPMLGRHVRVIFVNQKLGF